MKKLLAGAVLAFVLFLLTFEAGLASANPFFHSYVPKTKISIQSPTDIVHSETNISLQFTVDQSEWLTDLRTGSTSTYPHSLNSITCYLDGNPVENVTAKAGTVSFYELEIEGPLAEGKHTIEVATLTTGSFWGLYLSNGNSLSYSVYTGPVRNTSGKLNFTVDVLPVISNLSLENKTYTTTKIPLAFKINVPVSGIWCSVDNSPQTMISANVTLTLPEGSHSIAVFTKDMTGNTVQSGPVYFTISIPAPVFTPTPIPTTSQTPLLTPSTSPSVPEFPTWIILPLMAAVATILFYVVKKGLRDTTLSPV